MPHKAPSSLWPLGAAGVQIPLPALFLLNFCVYLAGFRQDTCLITVFCFAVLLHFTFRFKFVALLLTIVVVGLLLIFVAWIFTTIGFFTMKSRQYQQYSPQPNGSTPPSTQPEQGKITESKGMNNNKYAQLETLGRRGI
jgi:hypothetical protein